MQENSILFSPIKDRILLFAKDQGITPNFIYTKSGMSRGVLGQKNGISELNLSKFLDAFPNANPTWIVVGKGEMKISENTENVAIPADKKDYKQAYYELLEENRELSIQLKSGKDHRLKNIVLDEFETMHTKIDQNRELIQNLKGNQQEESKTA